MTNTTFGNWQLSSSDNEDDKKTSKKVNANISKKKPKQINLDISAEEYVPLSARLKMQGSKVTESSEDDLPVFKIKNLDKLPVPGSSNKENLISVLENNSTISSSPKKKLSNQIIILDDDNDKLHHEMNKVDNLISEKVKNDKKEEAAKRKALTLHLKNLKPEECMKYMECMISRLIISMFEDFNFMEEMKKDFAATCTIELFDAPCVRWSRKVTMMSEAKVQSTEIHNEPEMLVLLPASEFVKMVEYSNDNTLTSWVKKLQFKNPGLNIHLVCHGIEKYYKNLKRKKITNVKNGENGSGTKKRKKTTGMPDVSVDEIEEALVDLQIECKTTVLYIETPMELVNMIKQLSKSIGEAPYKRMKRNDVLFINEIPSVKINPKTGEGLKKVWKQMIQQFHNVTPVMTTAITDRYPTLLSLVDAYENCGSDTTTAEALLADIPVRRGVGTLQTSRRIGPELSYKIYRMLMSRIPSERLY